VAQPNPPPPHVDLAVPVNQQGRSDTWTACRPHPGQGSEHGTKGRQHKEDVAWCRPWRMLRGGSQRRRSHIAQGTQQSNAHYTRTASSSVSPLRARP
jgi:hypothetical protein